MDGSFSMHCMKLTINPEPSFMNCVLFPKVSHSIISFLKKLDNSFRIFYFI